MYYIIWFLITIGVLYIIGGISKSRKWQSVVKEKPKELAALTTNETADTVVAKILRLAEKHNYLVENVNQEMNQIILRKNPSLGIGWFFPIYVTKTGEGKTVVKIGVVPIIYLLRSGYAADREQKKIFDIIRNALGQSQEGNNG